MPKSDSISQATKNKANALSMLTAGGGNVLLQIKYPILYMHSFNNTVQFQMVMNPKLSGDIVDSGAFGTYAGMGAYGVLSISTMDSKVTFVGEASYSQTWGNTSFMNEMGLTGDQRRSFNLWSATFGFQILKSFGIQYSWYGSSNSFINSKVSNNNVISFNKSF